MPGEIFQRNFSINTNEKLLPGVYSIVVLVKYNDKNMHSFSNIASHLITYEKGFDSNVIGDISTLRVMKDSSGTATLTIKNLDDKPHIVNVSLYLPDELYSTFSKESISMDLISEKKINFEIKSTEAAKNGDYAIYISLEYEDGIYHYSSFAQGIVTIKEKKEKPILLWISLIFFVVLLAVYVYIKIEGKK